MPADEDVMADASRPEGSGLDRRSLIKRAAVTEPLIVTVCAMAA